MYSGTVFIETRCTYIQLKSDSASLAEKKVQQCSSIKTTEMVDNGNS